MDYFAIYLDNINITNYVTGYTRDKDLCSCKGSIQVEIAWRKLPFEPQIGTNIKLYETGEEKGNYYLEEINKSWDGNGSLIGRDGSRLLDYFVSKITIIDNVTDGSVYSIVENENDSINSSAGSNPTMTARAAIEYYAGLAGVECKFFLRNLTPSGSVMEIIDTGAEIYPMEIGFASAYDIIMRALQESGWYGFFAPDNTFIITTLDESLQDTYTYTGYDILSFKENKHDRNTRNAALVVGSYNFDAGSYVRAFRRKTVGCERDEKDVRTIAIFNPNIYRAETCEGLAANALYNLGVISDEVYITVIGCPKTELSCWINVDLQSRFDFSFLGMVTAYQVRGNPREGLITDYTLNKKCPRLLGFGDSPNHQSNNWNWWNEGGGGSGSGTTSGTMVWNYRHETMYFHAQKPGYPDWTHNFRPANLMDGTWQFNAVDTTVGISGAYYLVPENNIDTPIDVISPSLVQLGNYIYYVNYDLEDVYHSPYDPRPSVVRHNILNDTRDEINFEFRDELEYSDQTFYGKKSNLVMVNTVEGFLWARGGGLSVGSDEPHYLRLYYLDFNNEQKQIVDQKTVELPSSVIIYRGDVAPYTITYRKYLYNPTVFGHNNKIFCFGAETFWFYRSNTGGFPYGDESAIEQPYAVSYVKIFDRDTLDTETIYYSYDTAYGQAQAQAAIIGNKLVLLIAGSPVNNDDLTSAYTPVLDDYAMLVLDTDTLEYNLLTMEDEEIPDIWQPLNGFAPDFENQQCYFMLHHYDNLSQLMTLDLTASGVTTASGVIGSGAITHKCWYSDIEPYLIYSNTGVYVLDSKNGKIYDARYQAPSGAYINPSGVFVPYSGEYILTVSGGELSSRITGSGFGYYNDEDVFVPYPFSNIVDDQEKMWWVDNEGVVRSFNTQTGQETIVCTLPSDEENAWISIARFPNTVMLYNPLSYYVIGNSSRDGDFINVLRE